MSISSPLLLLLLLLLLLRSLWIIGTNRPVLRYIGMILTVVNPPKVIRKRPGRIAKERKRKAGCIKVERGGGRNPDHYSLRYCTHFITTSVSTVHAYLCTCVGTLFLPGPLFLMWKRTTYLFWIRMRHLGRQKASGHKDSRQKAIVPSGANVEGMTGSGKEKQ